MSTSAPKSNPVISAKCIASASKSASVSIPFALIILSTLIALALSAPSDTVTCLPSVLIAFIFIIKSACLILFIFIDGSIIEVLAISISRSLSSSLIEPMLMCASFFFFLCVPQWASSTSPSIGTSMSACAISSLASSMTASYTSCSAMCAGLPLMIIGFGIYPASSC